MFCQQVRVTVHVLSDMEGTVHVLSAMEVTVYVLSAMGVTVHVLSDKEGTVHVLSAMEVTVYVLSAMGVTVHVLSDKEGTVHHNLDIGQAYNTRIYKGVFHNDVTNQHSLFVNNSNSYHCFTNYSTNNRSVSTNDQLKQ